MNKILHAALAMAMFACASLILLVPASAQSVYGSIFGTVKDKSGALIPGAKITVKNEAKGTVVAVTTNSAGDYSVQHLIPDVYDLSVSAKGFKGFENKGISVLADTAPRVDPVLEVGGSSETITVTADQEPELKTDKADVSTVFDEQQVSSLPVGDQNFTNLQLLIPGAQLLSWSHAADENPQASKQIQIDGQPFGGTAFGLDGTDNQDPILGIIVINPTMDAVTETKITTQNFDAELGKALSAFVSAQTRSGSNKFHGSAYDFRTGNANLARDPYSQAPGPNAIPAGLKNRMGGSIGGPILKNKAFFFFNYEGQRQKVGTEATDSLPDTLLTETALGNTVGASGIAGADFSHYAAQFGPAGQIYNNTAGAAHDNSGAPFQFPNNVIPKSLLSPQALALLKVLEPYTKGIAYNPSAGNDGNLDSNYHEAGTGLFNSNQWTERVDYTLSEKMHAFERFSRFTDILSGSVMFGTGGGPGFGINNYGGNSNGANDSLAAGMDIAISPKLVTDFRLGYYRYNVIDSKHDQGTEFAKTLGIPGINMGNYFTSGSPGFFIANVPGGNGGTSANQVGSINYATVYGDGLGISKCNCPLTEREDEGQVTNNWTYFRGNHEFKVGADLRYGRNLRVPSDNDRDGLLYFNSGATSDQVASTGGLGLASFLLGDVTAFNRYVSVSTNAKEFQKRTFFYAQDKWRATTKLTFNLGLRWELYFPEKVNAAGNGSLLNLDDGYLHVAGVGGNPANMGWDFKKMKQFAPRIGITYQYDPKTVIRAGYGRSFDSGNFGAIFGMVVTQNLPVLANQALSSPSATGSAFGGVGNANCPNRNVACNSLGDGPSAYAFPTIPASGLLPNPGAYLNSKARPAHMTFHTIDAWNLSVQRAVTPTLALTVAYVGNKGTHTTGDYGLASTNPNEAAINLPGNYSFNGQSLHYDPTVANSDPLAAPINLSNGATRSTNLLQRYYGSSLPACMDASYSSPGSGYDNITLPSGACGWTSGIQYNGNNQNTEFDALQITLAKSMLHGLSMNANYQWASAFDEQTGYYTWDHRITHQRDTFVRNQQLVLYGSYDLPFGKGKQFLGSANRATDLLIGGYQLSGSMNWAGGLPFSVTYNNTTANIPGSAPGIVSAVGGRRMKTSLSGAQGASAGTITRKFYDQQVPCLTAGCSSSSATGDITQPADVAGGTGVFVNPGLDNIGNAGLNTYRGPAFFTSDIAFTKAFSIWEKLETKFRMDAYNAFNHINPGNPSGNIETAGTITSEAAGCVGSTCGPRQMEFSLRVQF